MRKIDTIIIHCAATYPNMDIGVKEIRQWHTRDNGWADIGYHYVIRRNGEVEQGRPLTSPGVHCAGHNARSIGVCLIGGIEKTEAGKTVSKANYTDAQWAALGDLVRTLHKAYPDADVRGHQDFANKACPCFDVVAWWQEHSDD